MSSPPASTSRKLRTRAEKTESKFDRIRRLRATGESALTLHSDQDSESDDAMYMNVDEDEYQRTMQNNIDDFVVDDDGSGYTNKDLDDIGTDLPTRKQQKMPPPTKKTKEKQSLSTMFRNAQLKTPKVKKEHTEAEDEQFMSSLISGLEAPVTPSKSKPNKRRLTGTPDAAAAKKRSGRPSTVTTYTPRLVKPVGLAEAVAAERARALAVKQEPVVISALPSLQSTLGPATGGPQSVSDDNDDDIKVKQDPDMLIQANDKGDDDGDDDDELLGGLDDLVDIDNGQQSAKPLLYPATEEEPQGTDWQDVQLTMTSEPLPAKPEGVQATESTAPTSAPSDGTALQLYWLDATEASNSVFIFGKTLAGSRYVSCCVRVTGLVRNVFLLPRINPETNERFSALAVHQEFESLALRHGVRSFTCKPCQRHYAFEETDVPASTEYLKVVYGFDQPQLPAEISGATFERAFGTSYGALELLLLKRRMMGPCWLSVQGARPVDEHDRLSWCQAEYAVADPKAVRIIDDEQRLASDLPRVPPLTTMTLSLKTAMDARRQANEVVAISVLVHRDVSLDDTTPAARRTAEQYTLVRQLSGTPWPADFERLRQTQARHGLSIDAVRSEAALLNLFTALLKRIDPDVLAAHNFYGFDLDVLLHRMQSQRTDGWSKLGRLRRRQMPRLQTGAGGMGESTYGERQVVAGRVVCDTYLVSRDLVRAKSYAMGSLAMQELGIRREDLPFERIPEYFADAKSLLHFLRHAAFDAFLAAALMVHLQALPLTKQLTNLAGNLWSRTLMGARAERNEFLLLHEFYRNKFIRPDRFFGPQKPAANGSAAKPVKSEALQAEMAEALSQLAVGGGGGGEDGADDDETGADHAAAAASSGTAGKPGRRKPAYLGGLVLEPKRGFYDRFVLLLDFNSLYPSIIQEFNICFTTVRRPQASDAIPDAPSPELPPGILPRLLKTLVDRRRQVKQLLKRPGISAEEAGQLHVRQQALKLTANSMYGCLGFTHSRFYAKPLAMLITSRGREILQATRDLALGDGLEVIYGDTDSIMIATRSATLQDAYELGAQFKRRVNERYRLLELDIDGVFKRLLLLKKKKYAALQIINPEKHRGQEDYRTKLESKGLDLVRRDWCDLSHDVSGYVLEKLFADHASPDDTGDESTVITAVHEYLTTVGQSVRGNQVPLAKYTVHKGLTKPPENYPDRKSQPHVLVALRLRERGVAVRAGDTIPYIICDAKCPGMASEAQTSGSYAERARHPDEIRDSAGQLYPDFEWYLNQQVLPPCARLLEPLPGTDMATMAQALGLDPSKYRSSIHNSGSSAQDGDSLRTLDSQIPDSERFKYARLFHPTCPACKQQFVFEGVARRTQNNDGLESGLKCTNCNHMA
ncbi:DNA-directed DNA polymerase alpha catalytic subunit pol1, partial [Coemansia sp. Benny D115]